MANFTVIVHPHEIKIHDVENYQRRIIELLHKHWTDTELDKIDVFNMDGDVSNPIFAGNKKRLVILGHYPLLTDDALVVNGDDGQPLFTFIERGDATQQLNIVPNVFGEHNDDNVALLTKIIHLVNKHVFLQRILDYSWKSTTKKEQLTAEFTEHIKRNQLSYIKDDKRKLGEAEGNIRYYTDELKKSFDSRTRYMQQIEVAEKRLDAVSEKLLKDLDNIVANPKVKELFIKDGKFIVHTEPVYAYHDETGERYYIGNMRIEMNPQNTEVKFYGDNPRKSYWSHHDPHPHVSGESGNACLGNVASTIAELCSQMELYALTMVCIDFLESVNTSDSAGKNIVNWDRVDEKGNIIEEADSDYEELLDYGDDDEEDED